MNLKEAKELVKKIKEKYPRPSTAVGNISKDDTYCVGGAYCLYLAKLKHKSVKAASHFPSSWTLFNQVEKLNDNLDVEGYKLIGYVLKNNDNGQYAAAWEKLEQALSYKPSKKKAKEEKKKELEKYRGW